MAKVLEGNEYKSYIMAILASALFSEDTKVPVTLTDYIYDPTLGKFQNEINAEVSDPKTVTVFVFKSTANETDPNVTPNPPTGGSWDMTTDILQLPEGWTTNDELDAPVWLSYGVFGVKNGESTLIQDWSTPIRISGVDGIDGKDGNGYTYIYARTENSDTLPTQITNLTIDQALTQGWTDSPKGITEILLAEWVAILPDATDKNPNPKWQGPVLWSKWGVNGKDGDGIEYIYCQSKVNKIPAINPNEPVLEREYVPDGDTGVEYEWTDSPSGVNKDIPYEWVSIRKFNHETQTWGTFSDAKIWAKYGEKGESGQSVWIAYNDSEEQPVGPNNTIDLGNGWYFADKATENNKPVWWCLKISQTVEGGTWGPVLKLNGKDGTSVTIKSSLNSEDDLCSIDNSEIGDSYLIGENLYIRVESESEGVNTCGNGTYWKNAGVIKGPKGDSQYLHIRYADRIECDESNVCKYIFTKPDGTQPGRYLGTYVSNYKSADEDENITVSTAYSWYDTKGEQGVPGAASEFYILSANTNVIIKKSNGEYDPVNIIPYLKHVKGNVTSLLTAVPEGYELFYWNDKNEEEDKWEIYTDLGEGLGIPVNSLNEKIKFKLLRDSDNDNDYELVDELEVPIVADGSDAYTIVYSDQNVAIECDFAGTPVDLEPRHVEIRVMKGSLYVNIKSGDNSVEYITVTIDPDKLESVTTVFPGTLLLLDGTELNYSINAIKVQQGKPAQNPVYILTSQTSVLYECGIEPESGEYYLKSPVRAVELTFTLYEGLTQQTFSTNLDVEIESLSSSKTPFDSILEKYKLDTENKTLTVTIPNLYNDENLKNYGDFKITVSDIYNDKDVYAEVYVDFYIQEGVITKPLFAFTKTNDDISNLPLTGLNTKETYTLPISEGYTWSSNTNITGNGQLWKAEGLAEIRKTSTETTYNVTWYKPYMLLDNDSREIIYTDKKDKESIPSIKTYGGPTAEWFDACNAVNWYDDTVDSNGNTFEAMWMATNDKKSSQDWDDKNWVFSLLYNDNITYKIVTDLSSQPTPGYTSFTAKASKLINGILDNTFTPNDYKLEVKVGDNIITPISDYYNAEFTLGEIITIKLFINNALVEIFTAKVSKGDKGDPGDKGDKGDAGDKGDPGNDACQINIDKPVVTFITDETQGFTINDTNVTVCIQVYKGGVKHNIALTYLKINYKLGDNIESSSGEIIYNYLSSNGSCVITRTITNGNLYIDINVSGGVNVSDIFEYIDINYKVEGLGINANTKITSVFVPQGSRGEVGPMGETGPLMYPAGEWKAQAYSITNNTAPYVYYKDTKKYYVLQKNCSSLIKPTNTSYWTEITQYEAIWTKVLMANFANIASAVFWGNYMFSEQGVTKDGNLASLDGTINGVTNYATYAESMFDAEGKLNGTITPNIVLDFNTGEAKFNKLSTPFTHITYDNYDFLITADNSYNLSILDNLLDYTGIATSPGSSYNIPIIYMPDFNNIFDGTNFKIIVQPSLYYQLNRHNLQWDNSDTYRNIMQYVKVICADYRVQNPDNYQEVTSGIDITNYYYNPNGYASIDDNDAIEKLDTTTDIPAQGFFIVNGMKTKFLFLLPGSTVLITSCKYVLKDGTNTIYWYVLNENLAQIPVKIEIHKYFDESTSGDVFTWAMLNNNYGVYGPSPYTSRNAFGSKEIRDLLDTYVLNNNVNFASSPANFRLILEKTGNEIKPYTSTLFNLDVRND